MVLGHVVGIHINDEVLEDGKVDLKKIRPLSRLGYLDYSVVDNIFEMPRPEGSPRPDQVKK
jgi:flavin reductase (DIM6/NTAB) family NADH-FMN oxidoreductase RutF